MNDTKFSMNALVVILIIFSAIAFFFTIRLVNLAARFPVNEFYAIEGTDLGVRYSSVDPDGIYQGSESVNTLKLEGTYGYDWGLAVEGDKLYVNEYGTTDVGVTLCDLVKVDLGSFDKEVMAKNAILRGRCKSGELVCLSNYIMSSNHTDCNSLTKFYSMSSMNLKPESNSATVMIIDPETGETLLSFTAQNVDSKGFEARYLNKTLDEIKAETEVAP